MIGAGLDDRGDSFQFSFVVEHPPTFSQRSDDFSTHPAEGSLLKMNGLRAIAALGGVIALLLAGCAAAQPSSSPTSDPSAGAPAAGIGDGYLCSGTPVTTDALEARAPLSTLSSAGSIALAEAKYDDGSPLVLDDASVWWINSERDDVIEVMREFVPDESLDPVSGLAGADHQLVIIQFIGDAPNMAPGWLVKMDGHCAMTIDLGELTVPDVNYDPAMPPMPDSTVLHLLVTERSCNSGQDAAGRVELVSLDEDATSVSLVVGVRPRGGSQTCPGHPPTPFEVTLSEPLGDRTLLDATLATPRPVAPWESLFP